MKWYKYGAVSIEVLGVLIRLYKRREEFIQGIEPDTQSPVILMSVYFLIHLAL